jgi:acyl carrier protein
MDLPRLPLNPNGKVDLAALPLPPAEHTAPATALTAAERTVLDIWQESLGRAIGGAAANFFELGGNSIDAARVRSRLAAAYGVDVPLQTLFDHPTVAALATAVAGLAAPAAPAAPVPVAVGGRRDVADLLAEFER